MVCVTLGSLWDKTSKGAVVLEPSAWPSYKTKGSQNRPASMVAAKCYPRGMTIDLWN
jgi:hypothetical protein